MELDGILGGESTFAIANRGEIFDQLPRPLPCKPSLAFAMESKISPQRAAKKSNAVEYHLVVIQYMDILWRLADEIVGNANVMKVVLVIARHVDHGGLWKIVSRPLDTAQAHTYVAGENDNVRVDVRR